MGRFKVPVKDEDKNEQLIFRHYRQNQEEFKATSEMNK
jgi:hypothetical protein